MYISGLACGMCVTQPVRHATASHEPQVPSQMSHTPCDRRSNISTPQQAAATAPYRSFNFSLLRTDSHLPHLPQNVAWRVWLVPICFSFWRMAAAFSTYCIRVYYMVLYSITRCYDVLECIRLYCIILYYPILYHIILYYPKP